MERLWAGWRSLYVEGADAAATPGVADLAAQPATGSLFERILASGRPDSDTYIIWRGAAVFAILNLYPYTTGHVLVLPYIARPQLHDLTDDESTELWDGARRAAAAVTEVYHPEGLNIGLNLGRAAGAGVPDHLHLHVVPRWSGDTNFMTALADTRIAPEALDRTWERLVAAWPGGDSVAGPGSG